MSLPAAPDPFYVRVEDSLANRQQRAAFDRASTRFSELRRVALDGLPEAEAVRDRARLIRAHTVAHLDRYLAQFETAVTAAGGRVHWAEDAAAATRIVVDIARAGGVALAVKSK